MGSVEEMEDERVFDVEETIFVAVGKHVQSSKSTLLWAVQNFAGKKICVLHVHQSARVAALTDRKLDGSKFEQHAAKAFQQFKNKKVHEFLDEYLRILSEAGVESTYKLWIEMDNVENGIIELIALHNIKWLVMGAASDACSSRELTNLKSKKAIFVCQEAPVSCHIWFASRGCLIYTRQGEEGRHDMEAPTSLLQLNSSNGTEESEQFQSEYLISRLRLLDVSEDADELERRSGGFSSQCSLDSCLSINRMVGSSRSVPLMDEEEGFQERATGKINDRLERTMTDTKNLKRKIFEETVKRWKEEDNAMEAKCKAKALESLSVKEMSRRKEIEELLEKEKQETERMKNQQDELMKELQMVQEQNAQLEAEVFESQCSAKELEEKIISAVELLISFKKKRDDMRIEHRKAIEKVKEMKKLIRAETAGFCGTQFLEFSFMEINEATHDFDPSWKIGEGKYGSVYRGLLRHMHVAIKMLPSYGSQNLLEFQKQVELLSKVRHPNLVTLIGTCPEARSLVYEYLRNGSLEDHLSCRENTPSLPWETRIWIASEICSALIFLHSSEPCITHGKLKSSNVLLDSNFVCKVSDFGIYSLIPKDEDTANSTTFLNESDPKVTCEQVHPSYFEAGEVTPESDVYSFGIILLQLLTRRPISKILRDVKCALENDNFSTVLDGSAGDWPLTQARDLAYLAQRCCEKTQFNQPDLSEILCVLERMRASSFASPSHSGSKAASSHIPSHFICPIFQEVMKDPHIAADGFTYEADAIKGWLQSGHKTSPMTNLKLENCSLLPNYALHQAIQEWQQQS